MRPVAKAALIIVVVLLSVGTTGAAWLALRWPMHPGQPPLAKAVNPGPSGVIINLTNIPDTGWQQGSFESNATEAWTTFTKPGQYVSVTFNLTLWTANPWDAAWAPAKMNSIINSLSYSSEDGGITGADASRFWSYNGGYSAGMVVRRYNVIFLILAISDNSSSLTKYDLGSWAGWQLTKVESLAFTIVGYG